MSGLRIVALVLDVSGLAIAAYGFRQTWQDHARGERFLPERVRRAADRVRRFFGGDRQTHGVGVAISTGWGVGEAHGFAREQLPDLAADPVAFRVALERQLDRFQQEAMDVRATMTKRLADLRAETQERFEATESELQRVESVAHEVAVGGLRWEVVGWSLVLVGTVVGAFG